MTHVIKTLLNVWACAANLALHFHHELNRALETGCGFFIYEAVEYTSRKLGM
jgi:hypothetical protein